MTSAAAARDALDRLRPDLHDTQLLDTVLITASFGVAGLTADAPHVEAWLRLTDHMLYRDKHLNRGCVVVLGERTTNVPDVLMPTPVRPSYSNPRAQTDPLRVARLLAGLAICEAPFALFDPSDRLAVANLSFLTLYAVQNEAVSFADIFRFCHVQQVGSRIATDDIEAWLRAADGKRRSQPQRNSAADMVHGRWFHVLETSCSDGWLMVLLFETRPPAANVQPAVATVLG